MKRFFILTMTFLITGCSHHMQPVSLQRTEKINSRILVYMDKNFTDFQSVHPAVIKTLSFKFNEPITKFLPGFFNEIFASTNFTNTKTDLGDDFDYLVIPKFGKVFFDSDRTFGHELRVTVSMSFAPADGTAPIVVSGTGLAQNMYGGKTVYEQELAEKALEDALIDLKKHILEKKSDFENIGSQDQQR